MRRRKGLNPRRLSKFREKISRRSLKKLQRLRTKFRMRLDKIRASGGGFKKIKVGARLQEVERLVKQRTQGGGQ